MLEHHIQRSIVYKLALSNALRFSELQPAELENKLFTYHLKKVVAAGYVAKDQDGLYQLTPEGRRLGVHVLDNTQALIDRAYSVLFLAVKRAVDGAWLLYRRKNHPLIHKVGFMHATPTAHEAVLETARKALQEKTGLTATFTSCASGYFRVYTGSELESFTHFTLLLAQDAAGELVQSDILADYFWVSEISDIQDDLLPNMQHLIEACNEDQMVFIDEIITY